MLSSSRQKRFIISPVDGYIHLLPVKTVGGVVTTARPVATIVPENAPLAVDAVVFMDHLRAALPTKRKLLP
ncbi:MAG: HlyD family efflux transporter periplasmic adaptor subunit [Deltaproteobacteria bacterium]|nr:HlyD family efflux transporter periplasmic adaptor subunit [Deltaproteobacteria bacterium]